MDEREDYYDSLIIDHDVKIVVVVDHMDEALVVVVYRKKMIISRKRKKVRKNKEFYLFIFYIQINFDLLV